MQTRIIILFFAVVLFNFPARSEFFFKATSEPLGATLESIFAIPTTLAEATSGKNKKNKNLILAAADDANVFLRREQGAEVSQLLSEGLNEIIEMVPQVKELSLREQVQVLVLVAIEYQNQNE